ncbi:MAG: cobyrinate a,c-diamide synthase [Caloramator sp.]|nr:cobyrinate a,c-diamide synthase [Caloramator sp.]
MKGIVIAAPNSGSGKTLITMGIIKTLRDMNYTVFPCKVGPDYIDTSFLKRVAGKESQNLDPFLQGKEYKTLIDEDLDFCVIEGVMGYFDGIYNTFENSTYSIAKDLNLNTILVYTPKGEMFSVVPKIQGMVNFDPNIKGIILNRVSKKYYLLLKEIIEGYVGIKVLGFIEENKELEIKSRHLGLIQSLEIEDLEEKIRRVSEEIKKNVDLSELLKLTKEINVSKSKNFSKTNFKAAIAYDKAFSFYYRENIGILSSLFDVEFFSPIKDTELPDTDFVYIGGGYPELFKDELSANKNMLKSIRDFVEDGGFLFAECGGLMYLTEQIEDKEMVGIFKGKTHMTDKLQNFGYVEVEIERDCLIGKKGDKFTAHEFHKSVAELKHEKFLKVIKAMGSRVTGCGYQNMNAFALYPHVSFFGSFNILESILQKMKGE